MCIPPEPISLPGSPSKNYLFVLALRQTATKQTNPWAILMYVEMITKFVEF